jgi:CheY-like chemotaxis protein
VNGDTRVLVVEDDEDDFFLTQRALRKFGATGILHLDSGRAAIDYLGGRGSFGDREKHPLPDFVFLDLKMNHVSGLEVLHWIRDNPGSRVPKIFVLTGSNEPRDRELVKASGVAAGYIVKPLSAEHLKLVFGTGPLATHT